MENRNEMIEALLTHYFYNKDKYPMAAVIEKDANRASGKLDEIIEAKLADDQEEALQALMDVFNEAQRSGFYAGFQAAKELLMS